MVKVAKFSIYLQSSDVLVFSAERSWKQKMFALVIPGYFFQFHTIVFNNYVTDDTMMQKHHYQDKVRHDNAINRQQGKFS